MDGLESPSGRLPFAGPSGRAMALGVALFLFLLGLVDLQEGSSEGGVDTVSLLVLGISRARLP